MVRITSIKEAKPTHRGRKITMEFHMRVAQMLADEYVARANKVYSEIEPILTSFDIDPEQNGKDGGVIRGHD